MQEEKEKGIYYFEVDLMKFFKRFKSVYYTLIISYMLLIIFSTGLISLFLFRYFSTNFNQQIEKVNQKMLNQISNSISYNIVNRVESVAKGLVNEHASNYDLLYLFEHPLEGNYIKISLVNQHLSDTVSLYPDVIDSILVYYKKKNFIISSKMGVIFLDENPEKASQYMDWMTQVENTSENMVWILTRPAYTDYSHEQKDILTLVIAYPFSYQRQKVEGYIAINVKHDALYSILQGEESVGDIIVIGNDGYVISHSSKENLYTNVSTEDYVRTVLSSDAQQGNFIQDVHGVKSMISYVELRERPWKIVNITPIEEFYEQSETISTVILGISGVVLLLGVIYSGFFTQKIYKPLRMILEHMGIVPAEKVPGTGENEYKIINQFIDDLSIKVDQLETTLQYNLPLIKYNLVNSLFYNHIMSNEALSEQLKILGYKLEHPYFYCVVFQLQEDQMCHVSEENKQFIKFNIVSYIEGLSSSDIFYMAVPLSDRQTGVIINTSYDDDSIVSNRMMSVISYIFSNFKVKCVFGISRRISDLMQIHLSYKEVLRALEYQYFLPEDQVFRVKEVESMDETNDEIPEWIFEKFLEGLNLQDINQIEEVLTVFQKECRKRIHQTEYCHQQVLRLLNVFSQYLRSINHSKEIIGSDINEQINKVKDIEQLKEYLLYMSKRIFEYVKEKYTNQTAEYVSWAVKYISEHLHEDISLQSISDMLSLTPHYFSKIFKNETGVNFIDFLTDERMKKARELLITSDISVEQISEQVGLSSTSYFIRQFKRKYGLTPGQYRQQSMEKKD